MSKNQRRHPRKSLRVELQGEDSDGHGQLLFEGSDLSSGGAFLRTDLLLERDERLTVQFQLPGDERTVTAQARVAWVRRFPKDEEPAGMGLEFLSMEADDQALLTRFLQTEP
jgi:uncharacterized protein (TIGR02266 family)